MTCCHEESSVAMAHGYVKIEGKPLHGDVRTARWDCSTRRWRVYNAYADRVPVIIILGNDSWTSATGASYVEWAHAAQDVAAMVRDFTKWDDAPISLQHFAESPGAGVQDCDDASV